MTATRSKSDIEAENDKRTDRLCGRRDGEAPDVFLARLARENEAKAIACLQEIDASVVEPKVTP